MSKRIAGLTVVAVGAILSIGRSAVAQDPTLAGHHGRRYQISLTGNARTTVVESLLGATSRLSRPECRRLFEDFTDQSGRVLSINLAATGKSAADVLAGLHFVAGDDTIQCRTDGLVAAFTVPGSRVIHMCGQRFLQSAGKTQGGEILLIHELLHALGLGENPPTSSQITKAVMNRCW